MSEISEISKKKPRGKPFEGSGNPRGRPKLPEDITELKKLANAQLWGAFAEVVTGGRSQHVSANARKLVKSVYDNALEGSGLHSKMIIDRFLGQAPQSVDVTSDGEKITNTVIILPDNGRD